MPLCRTHMALAISLHGLISLTIAVALLGTVTGCQDQEITTTTRNLLRPGPMSLACVGRTGDGGVQTGLPLDHCPSPERRAAACDAGVCGSLFGIVANTARGDVAFFRTRGGGEPLVDLDHATPGFGFVPVGAWPRDVATSPDGCRAVTANAGSCDLSLIDVPGALRLASGKLERPGGGLVSTIIPHTAAGPLGARPEQLVIVPSSVPAKADDAVCAVSTAYRAYVSFPRCGLVAEIDLRDGKILRSLQITKDGYHMTDSPICPLECSGNGQLAASDASPRDQGQGEGAQEQGSSGASDAGPDAVSQDLAAADVRVDGAASDASAADTQSVDAGLDAAGDASGDSGGEMHDDFRGEALADASDASQSDRSVLPVSPAGVLPTALALMPDGGKLFISSGGATFITAVDIAKDGSFEDPRRIVLAGTRAQTRRLAISPPAAKVGQFLYAIAADRSVRVVSLALERECETNADVLTLPEDVDIKRASCFPVGDPATPPRRVIADEGPGLTFGTRLPEDVTFAKVARDPADEVPSDKTKITATPLVGVFAFVATSDGKVFVIDVEDENRITSDATSVSREHLPHRVRNALQGKDDEAAKESASVSAIRGAGEGGVPVLIETLDKKTSAGIFLRGKSDIVGTSWRAMYEAKLLARATGQLVVKGAELDLADRGADFCQSGVLGHLNTRGRLLRHGDIVEFLGCDVDGDCGVGRFCARVAGHENEPGLCLDKSRESDLFTACSAFLRGKREFLVRRAFRDQVVLDVLPLEPQAIMLQTPQPTQPCTRNEDCQATYLCALADRRLPGKGASPLSLKQGQCFRPGCVKDTDCVSGFCVSPLDGSPKVCAATPLPLDLGGSCKTDADCRPAPSEEGKTCFNDRSCSANTECRAARQGGEKHCESRDYVCSSFPGLRGRCVRPSACFAELQRYQVRAGRSFVIGTYRRVVADEQTDECVEDAAQSELLENRIPIGVSVYPAVAGPICQNKPGPQAGVSTWTIPSPNPCLEVRASGSYSGYRARGSAEGEQVLTWGPRGTGTETERPVTVLHYANPDIQFMVGLGHLSRIPDTVAGDATSAPMPERGLSWDLDVRGGYARLVAPGASSIALPDRLVSGSDGRLYIVDMGDRAELGSATRGQVLRWRIKDLALDTFQVK